MSKLFFLMAALVAGNLLYGMDVPAEQRLFILRERMKNDRRVQPMAFAMVKVVEAGVDNFNKSSSCRKCCMVTCCLLGCCSACCIWSCENMLEDLSGCLTRIKECMRRVKLKTE